MSKNLSFSEEYISLYDLIEWAESKHSGNTVNATYDLFTLLQENCTDVSLYQYHTGIKERLSIQKEQLRSYLLQINKNGGYFDDDIPF